MSKRSLVLSALMCGAAFAQSLPAFAGLVTDADLRGKKICWSTGFISSYNKDGSFDGNRAGHGTWSLKDDVLTVNAEHGSGAAHISKDGDTFHSVPRGSKSGQSIEAWGKYCN